MNSYAIISVKKKYEKYFLNKIISLNIDIIESYFDDKSIFYKLKYNDYLIINKYDYRNVIELIKYNGFKNYLHIIKNNLEMIIVTICIVVLVFLSKKIILNVNIKTNDTDLKMRVNYALIDYNVKKYTIKKSFSKIELIKKDIVEKFKNEIEWLEIKKDGYDYNVEIIKRKKQINNSSPKFCNYIAKKSGTIKSIVVKRGVLQVQENNFVSAGDVLINGEIIYDEKTKSKVCANGKITGEVWYKVNVSYPLRKKVTLYKNKGMYNITFQLFEKKYKLFKDKYNKSKIIAKFGSESSNISVTRSMKSYNKTITYTDKEATLKALDKAKNKLLIKLDKNSRILSENILKKEVINDKIYLEILLTVEEELGVVENY